MKKYLAEFVRRALVLLLGVAVTVTPLFLQAQAAPVPTKITLETVILPQNQQLAFSRANPLHAGKHSQKFLGTELKEKESEEDESDSNHSKRGPNHPFAGQWLPSRSTEFHSRSSHLVSLCSAFRVSTIRLNILNAVFRI